MPTASDLFGGTSVPLPAPAAGEQPGDRAVGVLADFFRAFLIANATAAWQSVAPGQSPCAAAFTHDPQDYVFNEKTLPAIYVTRTSGKYEVLGDDADWETTRDLIKAWWIFPPAPQERQRARDNITNGIAKALVVAVSRGRDPSYVAPTDTDPNAASRPAAPTAIRVAHATSTASVTYSGASLDGAIGASAIDPPRPVTLTLGGSAGAWAIGSRIVVTYLDRLGGQRAETFTVAGLGTLTTTSDATAVVSVAADAQTSTAGTLSVGLGAFAGDGTIVQRAAGFTSWHMIDWKDTLVPIRMTDGSVRTYDACEFAFEVVDHLAPGLADATRFEPQTSGPNITFHRADGSTIETSTLPDAGAA